MKQKKERLFTEEWQLYEKGKEYNYSLNLYDIVNTNERFFRGDQWEGVNAGGLPTPVFNIFKRIINYYTSTIMQSAVAMRYSLASPYGSGTDISEKEANDICDTMNDIISMRSEKMKFDKLISDSLTDAAITGDAVCYTYWDPSIKTGQPFTGDFVSVLVDNTNVFFGNPNSRDIANQPYILIAMRETVADLKAQARKNAVPESEIEKITPDDDTVTQSGDMARKELENTKCISLIKLWRGENGRIHYRKSVRNTVISDTVDTRLSLYPIAFFNWTAVKNSWHGQAVATGMIENQIFINKGFAMVMKHMMDTAFSKVIYDSTIIEEWSNRVGEAVAVNGPVENVAKVLSSGQMQSGMLDVINLAITHTKEFLGATDTALGDVKPNNTSAIIALQQASNMPLENIRRAFYQYIEDIGLVWLDFMFAYYDEKRLVCTRNGEQNAYVPFSLKKYKDILFDCRVDVGATNYWSEIASLNTLDNLLTGGHITLTQYLERLPDNLIPRKKELIEEQKNNTERSSNETENLDQ
ncbi:MAG: hypothetical protein CVU97_05615 [Firmicutes bacterium HGW-Firmicutes-21]|nr:MAG: hypothetical protein CVU97_05615 [Firmicutes bacterium HGW-Firmicutes-21]